MADSLPVVGESRKHKGLWFNFGHGHIGLAIGPSTGRLVTQMILTQKPFCDPEPYSPYRF
jgi:D-amino-acid dehydrogenase